MRDVRGRKPRTFRFWHQEKHMEHLRQRAAIAIEMPNA
jgi:hypothetical protein